MFEVTLADGRTALADAEYIRKQFARLDKDGPHCTLQIRTFKGNFTHWMNLSLEQVEAISQILQGVRPSTPYQAIIGLEGFYHDAKNVLVVPLHQFQGEIIHRDGRRERLEFKKSGE